jgi:hypothetical protein
VRAQCAARAALHGLHSPSRAPSLLRVCPLCVTTGENWTDHYYFVHSVGGANASLFIIAFFATANFVLVALFVAVILGNFETKRSEMEKEQEDAYLRLWNLVHGALPPQH